MKIITFIKRLFRKGKKYQIWDTSALSNHFEAFKNILKVQSDVTVVIPEGVSHEISVGRRNNENCKEIYKFIEGNVRNPRLILAVTPDSIRSWEIDEQVIYTTQKYYDKGYTTTLITCDRDQSFRAKLKKLDVKLIPAKKSKSNEQLECEKEQPDVKVESVPQVVPMTAQDKVAHEMVDEEKEEIDLPIRVVGKQCWLDFDKNVSVYDAKGKRKIFRQEGVTISNDDVIYYKETAYTIRSISKNTVNLVKMGV